MADRAFDWGDTIENDSSFTLLPEGVYPFTVVSFERGEHAGSDKIPPCKKAVLTIELDGGALGTTEITENCFCTPNRSGSCASSSRPSASAKGASRCA